MLDEKDLQAIAQLMANQEQKLSAMMDKKLAQQKTEILEEMDTKLVQQEKGFQSEILRQMNILIENVFTPRFDLLAEGQQAILEKLVSTDDVEVIESRIDTLEIVVKKHSREIADLKKAN